MGILSLYNRFLGNAVHHRLLRDILFSDHFLSGSLYYGCFGHRKEKLWKDEGVGNHCIYYDGSFAGQSHRYLLHRNHHYTHFFRLLGAGADFNQNPWHSDQKTNLFFFKRQSAFKKACDCFSDLCLFNAGKPWHILWFLFHPSWKSGLRQDIYRHFMGTGIYCRDYRDDKIRYHF